MACEFSLVELLLCSSFPSASRCKLFHFLLPFLLESVQFYQTTVVNGEGMMSLS